MTSKNQEYLDSLNDIRSLMDRSSRFISLSGLAGVAAGFWALCGAAIAHQILSSIYYPNIYSRQAGEIALVKLFLVAIAVLILAVASGIYFTTRKAKQQGESIWDKKILVLVWNIAVPLASGGIFCLILMYYGYYFLVAPATLIFYGLALFCAGNYTHKDVKQLAIFQIVLGLANCFWLDKELYFWAFGFGVMHIIYGILMYNKYERKA